MELNDLSILVPFRSDPENTYRDTIFQWNLKRLSAVFPETEIIVGESPDGPFNLSAARNDAFKRSTRPYVAIVDSDTIFNRSLVEDCLVYLKSPGSTWSLPYNEYHVLDQESGKAILGRNIDIEIHPEELVDDIVLYDPPRNKDHAPPMSGLVMISSNNYRRVGGFDERFEGWGFEDWAFRVAADNRVGPCQRFDAPIFHIWHPVKPGSTMDSPQYKINQELYNEYKSHFNRTKQQWV